jgi:phosphonate transport system substrate-binding protein
MKFKQFSALMVAAALAAGSLTATAFAAERPAPAESGSKEIDTLALQFVPSRDPEEIISGTSDLPELLIAAMADKGYTIGNVEITVSDSYEAAGEALAAGAIDVAWLPGGTYALYSDETDVVLTATRNGLSNDSETPADWNGEANATKKDGPQVTFYRALIYATPSEYGKELAAKVNAGEELTWEDLDAAQWAVMNVSSSAGYIYPTLWLMDKYDGKMITDLSNVTTLDGYASAFNQAASEAVDVIVCYADGRNDYEESWSIPADETDSTGKQGLGREDVIWNELNVIGVTDKIYNDTVAITMADPDVYNSEFIKDFQDAIIEIAGTEEGKAIFGIYSHTGFATAVDADYDVARAALTVVEN